MIDSVAVLKSRYFSSKAKLMSLISVLMLLPAANALATDAVVELATAEVRMDMLSREFRIDGVVEAINQATVSAQTSGTIEEILVDVDDYVEKGTVIVQLKDVSQKAKLKSAGRRAGSDIAPLKSRR
jgi:multidrug efflux pump subunit AcrA (membrane-fusion protein)